MKLRTSILLGCAALFTATSCTTTPAKKSWSEQVIENARAQIGLEIDTIEASGKCLNPVTLNSKGGVYYCGYIGTQFWNQGRTQEIKERVLHL